MKTEDSGQGEERRFCSADPDSACDHQHDLEQVLDLWECSLAPPSIKEVNVCKACSTQLTGSSRVLIFKNYRDSNKLISYYPVVEDSMESVLLKHVLEEIFSDTFALGEKKTGRMPL